MHLPILIETEWSGDPRRIDPEAAPQMPANHELENMSAPQENLSRHDELKAAVVTARSNLTSVEEKHERLLAAGSTDLREAGLEYASAVREYARAVMEWLAWLDRRGDRGSQNAGS